MINRGIAIILAIFLGGFGIHRFYIGRHGTGFLYLITCLTPFPYLFGFIDALRFAIMTEDQFQKRYSN